MPQVLRLGRRIASLACLLVCIALCSSARAQVTVLGTYQGLGGGLYHYSFSVLNNTPTTLALVTLSGTPGLSDVQNLLAPTGFEMTYDSGLELVSLLEDFDPATTPTFSPGSLNRPFQFDSSLLFSGFQFEALDINGGSITGNIAPAAAPEPGTLTLTLCALGAAALARRIRKGKS